MSQVLNCSHILHPYIDSKLFSFIAFLFLLVILWIVNVFIVKSPGKNIAMVLVGIGGFMNIAERALTGCVRDYISFFGLFSFNVYDLLVTTGLVYFVFLLTYGRKETKQN